MPPTLMMLYKDLEGRLAQLPHLLGLARHLEQKLGAHAKEAREAKFILDELDKLTEGEKR